MLDAETQKSRTNNRKVKKERNEGLCDEGILVSSQGVGVYFVESRHAFVDEV